MKWKKIIAGEVTGICLGTGLLAIQQGYPELGIPVLLIWTLNTWILFKPANELLRIVISSAGVGVSLGLGLYSLHMGHTLFSLAVMVICFMNLIVIFMEMVSD